MNEFVSNVLMVATHWGDNPLVVAMMVIITALLYDRRRLLAAIEKQTIELHAITKVCAESSLRISETMGEMRVTLAELKGAIDGLARR